MHDLTSVRQDVPRMAELAVRAVVERLDPPARRPEDVALPRQLVIRGTTSPTPMTRSPDRTSVEARPARAGRGARPAGAGRRAVR
ncbi:substrate-binding domain-containing protein [Geodermatophilus sp. SYSU D00779]